MVASRAGAGAERALSPRVTRCTVPSCWPARITLCSGWTCNAGAAYLTRVEWCLHQSSGRCAALASRIGTDEQGCLIRCQSDEGAGESAVIAANFCGFPPATKSQSSPSAAWMQGQSAVQVQSPRSLCNCAARPAPEAPTAAGPGEQLFPAEQIATAPGSQHAAVLPPRTWGGGGGPTSWWIVALKLAGSGSGLRRPREGWL